MPLSARDVLSIQSQQANNAVLYLSRLVGTIGSAAGVRTLTTAWQNDFNARRDDVLAALQQLSDNARAAGNTTQADGILALKSALVRIGPLAVDGAWGPNTAFSTALWISTSAPPSVLSNLPSWWSANSAALARARDAIAAAYSASLTTSPAPAPTPSPAPTPTPTPSPSPAPTSTTPTPTPTPTPPPRNYGSTTASGGGTSAGTVLAVGLLVGVIGWRLFNRGRS